VRDNEGARTLPRNSIVHWQLGLSRLQLFSRLVVALDADRFACTGRQRAGHKVAVAAAACSSARRRRCLACCENVMGNPQLDRAPLQRVGQQQTNRQRRVVVAAVKNSQLHAALEQRQCIALPCVPVRKRQASF
jgi:hypothetical protein